MFRGAPVNMGHAHPGRLLFRVSGRAIGGDTPGNDSRATDRGTKDRTAKERLARRMQLGLNRCCFDSIRRRATMAKDRMGATGADGIQDIEQADGTWRGRARHRARRCGRHRAAALGRFPRARNAPFAEVRWACGTRCGPGRRVRARHSGQARPTGRLACAPCRRRREAEEPACRGIAASSTRFIANAVFPIDGRPATTTRSPRCRPAVLRSNSVNLVGTPVIARCRRSARPARASAPRSSCPR